MKKIVVTLTIVILLVSGYLLRRSNDVRKNSDNLVYKINDYQDKISSKRSYLSKKEYKFSKNNEDLYQDRNRTIALLEKIFSKVTSTGDDDYQKTYDFASKYISDRNFVNGELLSLKNIVESTGLMMENVSVDVTAKESPGIYTVVVTYIPYYAKSDLYQKSTLKKEILIYEVSCVGTKVSKVVRFSAKVI
ncbi:hypothetical protein AALT52_01235 [Ligilactobacillus faecis]|uniref:Uncharacterized protein n=1 Tax=Ligilactobacillus faecis TaxID=762833 RepID=A0ABV4DM27_9LACO